MTTAVALHRIYDTSGLGMVEVGEEGSSLGFREEPPPAEAIRTLADTGTYVLEPEALEYIPRRRFFMFSPMTYSRACYAAMSKGKAMTMLPRLEAITSRTKTAPKNDTVASRTVPFRPLLAAR